MGNNCQVCGLDKEAIFWYDKHRNINQKKMANIDNPGFNPEQDRQIKRQFFLETRDKYKATASELVRGVAEIQGAKYETAFYQLMMRTEDSPEIINAMNEFLDALKHRSELDMRGSEENSPISSSRREDLITIFREAKDKLETRP